MTEYGIEPLTGEEWRPVVGWEDRYWISSKGRVLSLPNAKRKSAKLLSVNLGSNGYPYVMFWRNNRQKSLRLHVLLLEAFVGPRPPGMNGLHNDGNPLNHDLSNLRWGTLSENSLDAIAHGTHYNASKTHCRNGHPLEGDNVRQRPNQRLCVVCYRASALRWAHKQKEKVS